MQKYQMKRKMISKKDKEIVEKIENLEKEFEGNGRVLIRASGTEPLVRVMIEGENIEDITKKSTRNGRLNNKKTKLKIM